MRLIAACVAFLEYWAVENDPGFVTLLLAPRRHRSDPRIRGVRIAMKTVNLDMGDARWDCRYRTVEENSFSELLAICSGGILSNVQTGARSECSGLNQGEYKNKDRSQSCRD
jgi:hypothetical protein